MLEGFTAKNAATVNDRAGGPMMQVQTVTILPFQMLLFYRIIYVSVHPALSQEMQAFIPETQHMSSFLSCVSCSFYLDFSPLPSSPRELILLRSRLQWHLSCKISEGRIYGFYIILFQPVVYDYGFCHQLDVDSNFDLCDSQFYDLGQGSCINQFSRIALIMHHKLEWLKTIKIHYLKDLEVGSLMRRCFQVLALSGGSGWRFFPRVSYLLVFA